MKLISSRSSAEIAMSIMAQLVQVRGDLACIASSKLVKSESQPGQYERDSSVRHKNVLSGA